MALFTASIYRSIYHSTLRVNKKRMGLGSECLQVELSSSNSRRLDKIATLSGKTKIEIINNFILDADLSDFEDDK